MHTIKSHFPRVGMRIVKSAVAVFLCLFIYYLMGQEEIPFFLVMAALQSLQPYQKDVKEIAQQNVLGTMLGAGCSLVILLLQRFVLGSAHSEYLFYCVFVALGVAVTIYCAVVLGHGEIAQFSAVVYICIIMVHLDNESPFLYVLKRLTETLMGIGIGMAVNSMRIPRKRVKDTLFVLALDDVLHSESSILPEYSKVEINRFLDDGVRLSIITQHSSASFWNAAGNLKLKMPVILLDGAVLYDPDEKRYLDKVELRYEEAMEISAALQDPQLTLLKTAVVDDSVLIFCQDISESCHEVYKNLRKSNYRNYIHQPLPEGMPVVYVLCMGSEEMLEEARDRLRQLGLDRKYKIMRYKMHEYPGMAYLRIFSRAADREKCLEKLRTLCGLPKVCTFGNDPERYDVCVRTVEGESILRVVSRKAEPYFWKKT